MRGFTGGALAAMVLGGLHQSPTRILTTPEVEYREPFSEVEGVRELRDGRVIVIDSRERLIQAVDMRAGTATRIAREGDGPGEFRIPLRIFAFPGDSTAVYDMGNAGRPLLIAPNGTVGGSLRLAAERPSLDSRSATDARGRVYSEVRSAPPGVRGVPDSIGIERLDRATGKRDTIARVNGRIVSPLLRAREGPLPAGGGVAEARLAARVARAGQIPPFASRDQWAVAPDGRVAVVSVEPYRVRITREDGTQTIGPVLEAGRVPVTGALKDRWRADAQRPVPTLLFSGGGQMSTTSRPPRFSEPAEWPEVLPAFLDRAVSFAPDGMLWIQRAVAADSPPKVDVIDETGELAFRIVLPKQSKLVGFGTNSVYLVRVDEDDLQYLQRYRLPSR